MEMKKYPKDGGTFHVIKQKNINGTEIALGLWERRKYSEFIVAWHFNIDERGEAQWGQGHYFDSNIEEALNKYNSYKKYKY